MQAGQQEAAEEEHEYHGTRVCEEKDRKEASVAELQAEVVKKYDDIRALSAAIANKERDIKDLNARMTHGRRVGAESSLCVTRATWATMALMVCLPRYRQMEAAWRNSHATEAPRSHQ